MSKEKREKHVYKAIGPVAQLFGASVVLGIDLQFQRTDNGTIVRVRVETMTRMGASVHFNGTLRYQYDGESVTGEYNGVTRKTTLVTWFKL